MKSVRANRGVEAPVKMGDTVLVKRNGPIGWIIRFGEWLRFRRNTWSHVCTVVSSSGNIVEAEWSGVQVNNISKYRDVEYLVVHTSDQILADENDLEQALVYLFTQVGKPYGYLTIIGTATRFLTPGRSFAFIGKHNICSGLAAQALTRGTFNPEIQPVTMSPTELAEALGVSTK